MAERFVSLRIYQLVREISNDFDQLEWEGHASLVRSGRVATGLFALDSISHAKTAIPVTCLCVPNNCRIPLERRFSSELMQGSTSGIGGVQPNPQLRCYRDWWDQYQILQIVQTVPNHTCTQPLFWCCDHELKNTHSKNQCMPVSIASVQDWLLIQTSVNCNILLMFLERSPYTSAWSATDHYTRLKTPVRTLLKRCRKRVREEVKKNLLRLFPCIREVIRPVELQIMQLRFALEEESRVTTLAQIALSRIQPRETWRNRQFGIQPKKRNLKESLRVLGVILIDSTWTDSKTGDNWGLSCQV